jgi:hypothetical protein
MRSFRAENLSSFVKFLLDREEAEARAQLERLRGVPALIVDDVAEDAPLVDVE